MIDTLIDICNAWKLEVNVQKTKIAALRELKMEENYATQKRSHALTLILTFIVIFWKF